MGSMGVSEAERARTKLILLLRLLLRPVPHDRNAAVKTKADFSTMGKLTYRSTNDLKTSKESRALFVLMFENTFVVQTVAFVFSPGASQNTMYRDRRITFIYFS